jgi:hypothetical protein
MRQPRSRFTLPAFDAMASLARRDPDALEALRERLTDEVIRRASNAQAKRRLEGLKFRIDMERRRCPDPLSACIRISAMMHRSLADLHTVLEAPDEFRARKRGQAAPLVAFPEHERR